MGLPSRSGVCVGGSRLTDSTDELNLLADRSSLFIPWPKEVGVMDA